MFGVVPPTHLVVVGGAEPAAGAAVALRNRAEILGLAMVDREGVGHRVVGERERVRVVERLPGAGVGL
ncbi:Uncharacterised protein [Mycobacteroides abscessus subsp. abscessus]|nr:Uncharacterised protein [Mycobacteroides abscessus subsp. abscessus]